MDWWRFVTYFRRVTRTSAFFRVSWQRFFEVIKIMKETFTRIACDNVYLRLLLRLANEFDVEENPGPTIYGVVDPSKTV